VALLLTLPRGFFILQTTRTIGFACLIRFRKASATSQAMVSQDLKMEWVPQQLLIFLTLCRTWLWTQ
jgi:hypothetical protein